MRCQALTIHQHPFWGETVVRNDYEVLKGKRLKLLIIVLQEIDVPEIYFGNISKNPQFA